MLKITFKCEFFPWTWIHWPMATPNPKNSQPIPSLFFKVKSHMNNTKWWIRNLAHLNVTRESIFPDILKDSTGQQMLKTMLLSQEKTSIRGCYSLWGRTFLSKFNYYQYNEAIVVQKLILLLEEIFAFVDFSEVRRLTDTRSQCGNLKI